LCGARGDRDGAAGAAITVGHHRADAHRDPMFERHFYQ
jgi:hypothetical protein